MSLYTSTILADSPAGYWRLGELTGTSAADASGNAHSGTYTGGVTLAQAGAIGSENNAAAKFDGSSGYVDLGNPAAFVITTGPVTLEAWISAAAAPAKSAGILCRGNTGTPTRLLAIELTISGTVRAEIYNGSGDPSADSPSSIVGTGFHHAVFVRDTAAGLLRLYLDGAQVASYADGTGNIDGTSQTWSIGRRPDSSGTFFSGLIDEAAIYTAALSPARVLAHYNAGVASGLTSIDLQQIAQAITGKALAGAPIPAAPALLTSSNIQQIAQAVRVMKGVEW